MQHKLSPEAEKIERELNKSVLEHSGKIVPYRLQRRFRSKSYEVPGRLYAIQRSSDQAVKIGLTSRNVGMRLSMLRREFTGVEMRVLGSLQVDSMALREKQAHVHFIGKHVKGEWFSLDKEDVSLFLSGEWMNYDPRWSLLIRERVGKVREIH